MEAASSPYLFISTTKLVHVIATGKGTLSTALYVAAVSSSSQLKHYSGY